MAERSFVGRIRSASGKIAALKNAVIRDISAIYTGERTDRTHMRIISAVVRVTAASIKKFRSDDCLTKASSLTYTIILSLIPALAVALTVYSVITGTENLKEEIFRKITLFMYEHGLNINIDPVFDVVSGLIDNAARIGGISAVFMIFSATAMLRSMEKSFNDIWCVPRGRPIHLKIVYYWAAFTLGPLLLFAGMTVATQISTRFSAPNYHVAAIGPDARIWIAGTKGTILKSGKTGFPFARVDLKPAVDLEEQKVYKFDRSEIKLVEDEDENQVDTGDLQDVSINDIRFIGKSGMIACTKGLLLMTNDGGKTWSLTRFDTIGLNAIHMKDADRAFIAADDGLLFSTSDGGDTWDTHGWEEFTGNIASVSFYGERGMAVSAKGVALVTADGGKTWDKTLVARAKKGGRYVDLTRVYHRDEMTVWISAGEGMLFKSVNGGATWTTFKHGEYDFNAAAFIGKNEIYAGGDGGTLIHTKNGGAEWKALRFHAGAINGLLLRGKTLWATGDTGMIMNSSDGGATFRGTRGVSFLITLMNFFAPFAFIWLLFLMAYISLPNTRVSFRPAATGASVTSTVWVIFILLFIVYIKGFASSTFAIYGAMAAIPLFLLMVYASSVIVLFGAEISYTLMHPDTHRSLRDILAPKDDLTLYNGIAVLAHIYRKFENGGGATGEKELGAVISGRPGELEAYLAMFTGAKLVDRNAAEAYLPARSPESVTLADVTDCVYRIAYHIPSSVKKSHFRSHMEKLFAQISGASRKVMSSTTMKDIISKM